MKKQVPEVPQTIEVPKERQIGDLISQLEMNATFRRHRGQLCHGAQFLSKLASEAKSPAAFCKNWNALTGDLRILGNMMAKLSRDDREFALRELVGALSDPDHLFPGESHPIEKTVPVTLLMLDPARTLLMVKWILECHWMDLANYIGEKRNLKIDGTFYRGKRREITEALFARFPSLEEEFEWRIQRGDLYEGPDLLRSHHREVDEKYGHLQGNSPRFGGKKSRALAIELPQYNDHLEITGASFAYLVEADQKEVLSFFTREEQKTVATWQFRVLPESVDHRWDIRVGIHPEDEHGHWERECVGATSLGFSQGFGALIQPPKGYKVYYCSGKEGNDPCRIIFGQAR